MPIKLDTMPSTTALLSASADATLSTMAQRIVRKAGIPIFLSVNLPSDSKSMHLAAERRIIEELQNM